MDHGVKKQHRLRDAENFLQKDQVAGTAYGEKFREPLDGAQHNRFEYVH
jgi:hypothetical protein